MVPRACGPVFMFCALRLVLGWYRERCLQFSCFAFSNSFSAVLRTSGVVCMFCARGLIFGGTKGDGFGFHVLLSRTRFRRYQGRRVSFSCFALPDSFWAEMTASGPIFMFCAPGLVWGCIEDVGTYFHVLRSQTRF
jgi:hypothetical protein